jgi:hypothetical protein
MKWRSKLGLAITLAFASFLNVQTAEAARPDRGMRNCETIPARIENRDQSVFLGRDRYDFAFITQEYTSCRLRDGSYRHFLRFGLELDNGEPPLLIPAQYDKIIPYSTTSAFVLREDGRWATYRYRQGEVNVAPVHTDVRQLHGRENCQYHRGYGDRAQGPGIAFSLGPRSQTGHRDVALYFGDGPPVVLTGLGGPNIEVPIERFENLLIVRWTDEEGIERTRLHSIGGRPLSPVLGELTRWSSQTTLERRERLLVCNGVEAINLFVVGPVLDRNPEDLFIGHLLTPLGSDGQPMVLPEGAIGVFPVPTGPYKDQSADAASPYRLTRMWAVAYPSATGFEFTLSYGTLADAIRESPTAQRFDELGRAGWTSSPDIWYARNTIVLGRGVRDGLWHGRAYLREDARGQPHEDMNVASANTHARIAAAQDAEYAAYIAERDRRAAAVRAAFEQRIANNTACAWAVPYDLGRDAVIQHARLCAPLYSVNDRNRLASDGYPADVIAMVDAARSMVLQREADYRAEQAEMARNYVPPGAWEAAVRAAGDQAVRDIQQSGTNWLEQRRAQHNADWQRSQRAY